MSTANLPVQAEDLNPNNETAESSDTIKKNTHLVYRAALCWAFMFGFGESSFSLFANHLKTPMSFYGALVWIPGFVGPFTQILAANLLDRYKCRVKMSYLPVFVQAIAFIPLIIISFWNDQINNLYPLEGMTISHYIFLFSLFLYYMSGSFATPPWQSFIGDLVSQNERGRFFALVSKINSIFSMINQLLVCGILFVVPIYFPGSIQALSIVFGCCFIISFVARYISGKFIAKMDEMPYQSNAGSVFSFWQFIKRAPESNFVKFVIFVSVISCGMNISAPYCLPFWIDVLNYSNSQWIILVNVGTATSILTFMAWGRFSDIFGNKKTIKYCSILISIAPFGWLISVNFYYILFLQVLTMAFFTGFALSTLNYIYEAASPPKRARCFAYFSVLTGIGTFIGTQIGLFITTSFSNDLFFFHFISPFLWTIVISGLVRLLACAAFLPTFKELREVKPFQMNSFWVDVLELRSFLGISLVNNNQKTKSEKDSEK